MSKHEEFCTENKKVCIKNKEFCIKIEMQAAGMTNIAINKGRIAHTMRFQLIGQEKV